MDSEKIVKLELEALKKKEKIKQLKTKIQNRKMRLIYDCVMQSEHYQDIMAELERTIKNKSDRSIFGFSFFDEASEEKNEAEDEEEDQKNEIINEENTLEFEESDLKKDIETEEEKETKKKGFWK